MKETKLVICIPTWKRASYIDRVMQAEEKFLNSCGIDVYIYDSSPDVETLNVVNKYKDKINLFYKRIDENVSSNEKYFLICQEMAKSTYKYIWIMQDHMIITEEACIHLIESINEEDFVYLDISAGSYTCSKVSDINQFAVNCAWMLTRYGIAIMNIKTFLKNIDWEQIMKKWLEPLTINNSHVGLYFERLSEMEKPNILKVSFIRDQVFDFARSLPVSWNHELFRICLECWGNTITKFPDYYEMYKEKIMQSQDCLFFSSAQLLRMRDKGEYGTEIYDRYKYWINKIYPDRQLMFEDIATLPLELVEEKYLGKIINRIKKSKVIGNKVFIYGAGRHAAELADYLTEKKLEFYGFLVTSGEGNPERLCEHNVWEFNNQLINERDVIIVAVGREHIPSIVEKIRQGGHNNEIIIGADEL